MKRTAIDVYTSRGYHAIVTPTRDERRALYRAHTRKEIGNMKSEGNPNVVFDEVRVICPYCGQAQMTYLRVSSVQPQIVLCDIESVPGCDRYFAVDVRVQYNVEYHALVHPRSGANRKQEGTYRHGVDDMVKSS